MSGHILIGVSEKEGRRFLVRIQIKADEAEIASEMMPNAARRVIRQLRMSLRSVEKQIQLDEENAQSRSPDQPTATEILDFMKKPTGT